jgi:uncharacterized protein YcsI (UPF0317 family)
MTSTVQAIDSRASARPAPANAAAQARLAIRAGQIRGSTSGIAAGHVQGNLAILPREHAADFMRYCQLNPKPCPLLASSEPGDPALPTLGAGIDIRTDVPAYCVFRDGEMVEEVDDLTGLWRDDLVTFVLGCSFSFEWPLAEAGLRMRHMEQGRHVAMYVTSIETAASGPFRGPMVVSMRPFKPADAIRAIQISSRFPAVHGAPVHFGDPAAIGIRNIERPDFGDFTGIEPGEVPVFWACGVTPQSAIRAARPRFAITHRPGSMLICDRLNAELAVF